MSVKDGYQKLYKEKIKKPWFIFLNIWIYESKFVSILLKIFTILPFPYFLAKLIIKIAFKNNEEVKVNSYLMDYLKGSKIEVRNEDVKVTIKAI